MAGLAIDPGLTPGQLLRTMWRRWADPSLWPNERLFFEVYGQALQGHPHAAPLLDGIVESWVGPMTELARQRGVPVRAAPRRSS